MRVAAAGSVSWIVTGVLLLVATALTYVGAVVAITVLISLANVVTTVLPLLYLGLALVGPVFLSRQARQRQAAWRVALRRAAVASIVLNVLLTPVWLGALSM